MVKISRKCIKDHIEFKQTIDFSCFYFIHECNEVLIISFCENVYQINHLFFLLPLVVFISFSFL